jgi:PAS domain S-box-containing protein
MNFPESGFISGTTGDWFAAKGEFAERIRTFDWARTPLGARDHWSPALRFAANLCLSCAIPAVVIWGESHSTLYNESYAQLRGLSPESGQGLGFDELWPEAWAANKISINQVILNQQSFGPWKARIASFDLAYSPIYQGDGSIGGVFLLIQDVTEDLERKRNEELLKQVTQVARLGYIDLNIVTNQVTLSDEALEILGFPKGSNRMVHEELTRHVHPEDREIVGKSLEGAIFGRTKHDMDHRMVRPDGNVVYVRATAHLFRDLEGRPVRLLGTIHDVTERIQAKDALQEREERLRLALDASGAGSWMRDAHTGRVDWDDRFRKLYGFTSGEPASFEAWLSRVHEDDRRQQVELADQILHTKGHDTFDKTFRIVRPDGTMSWIQSLGQAHRDAEGRLVRLAGIELDVTEREQMEEERSAEGRRKDEFLSMLGHELRNPLATISNAMQLLSGGLTDEQRVSLNGMMERQVKLMVRLLDDLLDLGRMTHGSIQLRKERIDLTKLLQHVTEVTQSTAAQRGQELTLRLPSEIVTFKADEARLEQIAINLLSNASKYTPQGGRIEFSGAREGSEVVIRCKDNGRGIPPEMQSKIFEPFIRVEPISASRGEASLGIGLALVKRLVELHGGTISVESGGTDRGSQFVVRLPLESAPSDQPTAPKAKPASTSGLSRSIVLVEDNSDVARTLLIALEKAGYRVTLYADAYSALAGLSDLKPHAILLDIGLPGVDGYALAAKLKEKPHLQNTLFIGLSGFKRREAANFSDDFDHYFNKPVDLPALLAVLGTPAPVR